MKGMKKVLCALLVVAVAVSLLPSYTAIAQRNRSTEVPAGYTPIYTIADLAGINSNPSGKYILMNDIDMTKETSPGGAWDSGSGWTPLDEFSGVFDGNGYRIIGMHIYGKCDKELGLFSKLSDEVVIQNLGMVDYSIDVSEFSFNVISQEFRVAIGGIAGSADIPDGMITQCFASGIIRDSLPKGIYHMMGGIIGSIGGSGSVVKDCYSATEISIIETKYRREDYIGGIAGSSNSLISNCYAIGKMNGANNINGSVGGIIGSGNFNDNDNVFYLNTIADKGEGSRNDIYSGCKALTDARMKYPSSFTGFDFKNVWMIDELSSYPYPQLRSCPQVRVENLQLVSLPDKVTYSQGDKLDLSGAVVSVTYEDGVVASTEVDSSMVSGVNMNKIGEQTVTVSYLNKTCSFDISVEEAEVTDISLSKTSCSINRGAKLQLKAVIKPAKAVDKSVTWESDNEAVATVSKNGVVQGISAGSAVITATTSNGLTAECIVTVKVPATGIRLNTTSVVLKKGKKKTIKAQGNFIKSTMFKSSNVKIATVSKKGVVTAKKAGSCKITVTVQYRKTKNAKKLSEKKLTCKVTVKKVQSASTKPATAPTAEPTTEPTAAPTAEPTTEPTVAPTAEPSTGSKDEKDVAAISAVIAVQKALGATVSENLDSDEYSWSADGRLTGISWGNKNLQGSCSLQGLSQLTKLDVGNCTALTSLSCNENQLTSLNVDNCIALSFLDCSNNQLQSLDVSKCTALSSLHCNNNRLPDIDISNCKALSSLWCSSNPFASLNLSNCANLTCLVCQDNQLTDLNVSNCKALTTLLCDMNKLSSLDVSNCKSLTELSCFDNQLSSLDVSNCTALTTLHGGINQLISLNVSNCTALTHLGCNNNKLSSLDVSDCKALTSLDCFGNELVSLDVSNHTALTSLNSSENKLTNLNVSGCVALAELYCNNTRLTSLDVSSNTSLETLWCSNNLLTSLDVSNCTNLTSFQCDANVTVTGRK